MMEMEIQIVLMLPVRLLQRVDIHLKFVMMELIIMQIMVVLMIELIVKRRRVH